MRSDQRFRSTCLLALVPLFVALLSACERSPTDPLAGSDAAAFTTTDAASYTLPADPADVLEMSLVFSNRTAASVWFVHCGGPRPWLEKWVDGSWQRVTRELRALCLQATEVEAGATLRVPYRLSRALLEVDRVDGTYRLVWENVVWNFESRTGSSLFGDLLPPEFRTSNMFSLAP